MPPAWAGILTASRAGGAPAYEIPCPQAVLLTPRFASLTGLRAEPWHLTMLRSICALDGEVKKMPTSIFEDADTQWSRAIFDRPTAAARLT
jgi:hypothetical protein